MRKHRVDPTGQEKMCRNVGADDDRGNGNDADVSE